MNKIFLLIIMAIVLTSCGNKKDAEVSKIPYMIIIGEKEESEGMVSVRKHGEGDLGTFAIKDFVSLIQKEVENTLQQF